MGTIVTKFDGGSQLKIVNNSEELKNKMLQNIIDALNAVGLFVVAEAINNISRNGSVDIGDLLNSIEIDIGDKQAFVRIGSKLKYSIYVEKGTGLFAEDGDGRKTPWVYYYDGIKGEKGFRLTYGQKPKPFLNPAIEQNTEKIKQIIAFHLKKGMGD